MKKYLSIFALVAITLTGCNESLLDIDQKGVLPLENFYKTDADAEAALVTVYVDTYKNFSLIPEINGYNYGPYFMFTNFLADDVVLAGSGADDCVPEREYHDFRFTNDNVVVLGAYTALYRSIHKCNLVINNFTEEKLGSAPSATMKRCIAEARVMRAFDHLLLGIYWGTPPIVEEVLTGEARPTNSESQAAVMEWVAKECDLALPDLTEKTSVDDRAGAVKITKGFANAIKGKALLWKGDYSNAKNALKAVIDSKKYELVDDISILHHTVGDACKEAIFEFNCFVDGATVNSGDMFQRSASCNFAMTFNLRWENLHGPNVSDPGVFTNGWGWVIPTGDFARALIENDGLNSARRKAWIKTYDELLYDMQWITDKDYTPGYAEYKAKDASRGVGGNANEVYGCEGYFHWKRVAHPKQGDLLDNNWAGWNTNIMRYAEVLLMYAECQAMLGDADGSGLKALNDIQVRAGADHKSTSCTLDEVKSEKQFELWLEGCRGVDLIRWGDTATLEKADYYVPSWRDKLTDGKSDVHEGYIDESNATYWKDKYGSALGFHKGKNELLPFPKREIDLNPELKQNPNWN